MSTLLINVKRFNMCYNYKLNLTHLESQTLQVITADSALCAPPSVNVAMRLVTSTMAGIS